MFTSKDMAAGSKLGSCPSTSSGSIVIPARRPSRTRIAATGCCTRSWGALERLQRIQESRRGTEESKRFRWSRYYSSRDAAPDSHAVEHVSWLLASDLLYLSM